MLRQIILDTETTGLDIANNHRIIEIAGVELINRKLTKNSYQIYLNPERTVGRSFQIHGLSDDFLSDKPLFIDVERETMQINTSLLKKIPLDEVSAICVPNLIGNVANWEEIYNFAKENQLKTIEDSADTIGYQYSTDLNNWSDVSTTSFYASHVVTGAGFGGMACFTDKEHYDLGLSLRG